MASTFTTAVKLFYLTSFVLLISALTLHTAECVQFDVGGEKGWATPSSKNQQLYNDWASNNRFQVNDTLRFTYKKDSVMIVTEEEYEKCRSSHPIFFSNNGDTVLTLDRAGLFYFVSGVSGHCERGLKMVVKVLEPDSPPPPAAHKSAAAVPVAASVFVSLLVGVVVFV